MKTLIVGTAGHIDHGKTELIKALSGKNTDRLKEEKERGITIDLGFTDYILPSKNRISFVDVPGHEKFIRNMLAGITGVKFFMLIVAADEGIKEQTREHMEIINGLNIDDGIIVITKCDKCDEDTAELTKMEIEEEVEGTVLEGKKIFKVSSITGDGIENLVNFFEKKLESIEEDVKDTDDFRMAIDRIFTIRGAGTVVTGTVLNGTVRETDVLTLYPSLKKVTVRGIQAYGKKVKEGYKGTRCALNLTGVDKGDIKRGEVVSSRENDEKVYILNCKVTNIAGHNIKNRSRVRVYHGTKESLGRIHFLDEEKKYIQVRLEEEVYLKKGDYIYLKNYSPMVNLGGALVIEGTNKKSKGDLNIYVDKLKLKEKGSLEDRILQYVDKLEYTTLKNIELEFANEDIENSLNLLETSNKIKIFLKSNENIIISKRKLDIIENNLKDILRNYHKKNSLEYGINKEELRKKLFKVDFKIKYFNDILEYFKEDKIIRVLEDSIALYDFERRLNLNQKNARNAIIEETKKGLINVNINPIKDKFNIGDVEITKILKFMSDNKEVYLLSEGVILDFQICNKAFSSIKKFLEEKGSIELGDTRDLLGTNRKIALAILDELDKLNVTKRVENKRIFS